MSDNLITSPSHMWYPGNIYHTTMPISDESSDVEIDAAPILVSILAICIVVGFVMLRVCRT